MVLYKDEEHSRFVRHLVRKLGLQPVRYEPCGGCTQVLVRFVVELREMRPRMKYQRNLALIVVVDADADTVDPRRKALDQRLLDSGTGGPRTLEERIAYMIAAREIENWYIHLCMPAERPIDEAKDYI